MGAQIRLVNITLLHFLTRIIFYVFVFVAGYVTSRALSRHDFGQLQYISLWVNLSWIFLGLGVPNTISRHFTRAFSVNDVINIRKLVNYSIVASVVTLLLTGLLFVLLYRYVYIDIPFLPVLLMAFSQCLLSYIQVFMQGLYRYKAALVYNVIVSVIGTAFLLITIHSLGAVAYVYTILLVNIILCAGYGVTVIRAIKAVQKEPLKHEEISFSSLIKTSLFYAASAILAGILWLRFEISLLKEFFSYEKIAVYGIAFTVIALFAEPLKMLPSVLMYYFAGISDEKDKASLQFSRYFRHFAWLVIFAGIFTWADAESIITILYTGKYLESAYYLKILLIGMIPGVCSYVLMNMHVGLGKARFLVIQDLTGAVIFVVLLFLGNHYWQLTGIAWAKSIAMIVCVALGLWYTSMRLRYQVPYSAISISFAICALLLLPLSGIASSSLWLLLLKAGTLFAIYLFVSLRLKVIDPLLVDGIFKQLRSKAAGIIGR
jgi:O-antigen/teichoic acid export membrane protein